MDSLIVFEQFIELRKAVLWVIHHWTADIDENVSIFETNIRILGGLISTHLFIDNDRTLWLTSYDSDTFDIATIDRNTLNYCYTTTHTGMHSPNDIICINCAYYMYSAYFFDCFYNGELLSQALDLAERILPAFVLSKTNIPFGTVNLRHGVPPNETTVVCTACAGSFLLEFGVLSVLSDEWVFYKHAKLAAMKLFHARNMDTNLVGKHINNLNGVWTQTDSSLGTFIDSYLEYLLKAYFVFFDDDLLLMFNTLWSASWYHLNHKFNYNSTWYTEVRVSDGQQTSLNHDTFASFWPGLLSLTGNLRLATNYLDSMISVIVEEYQFMPELFDLSKHKPIKNSKQYFLRPEFIESLYHVFGVTRDEYYLDTAWNLIRNINDTARVHCGYATIENIENHQLRNSMDSFWMSETLKYAYLMFNIENEEHFLFRDEQYKDMMFTTEGHLLPLNIVHKIWNAQLKQNNETKHAFFKRFHWWNLEKFWDQMFDQLRKGNKLKFMKSRMDAQEESKYRKINLLKNFFKYIGNDQILYNEYQRIFIKKETNPLHWDIDKLRQFKSNTYDAVTTRDIDRNIFYKKTFENTKYDDEWVQMGQSAFWDCGQMTEVVKDGVENVFRSWSLHICDSYVHSKCWIHRMMTTRLVGYNFDSELYITGLSFFRLSVSLFTAKKKK
eukprot:634584_1